MNTDPVIVLAGLVWLAVAIPAIVYVYGRWDAEYTAQ